MANCSGLEPSTVPVVAAPTSFDGLRMWEGSQHRAFEELSFQLLKTTVSKGSRAIRTGNPDGGVEWYATLPDGSEEGWQAKHVKGIDSLLAAMTESVKRVAKERTTLRKLTFVISWNLSTGTAGKERKSQRLKYDEKIATWKTKITGASSINFELVQGSDLLDLLAKPEHQGRLWFWWGEMTFGEDWLGQRLAEQADAAGDKYRPDLQVDVPIQDDLLALGFDATLHSTFDAKRRLILSMIDDLHPRAKGRTKLAKLLKAISTSAELLRTAADGFAIEAGDPPEALEPLNHCMDNCLEAIQLAQEYEYKLENVWKAIPKDDQAKQPEPLKEARGYDVHQLVEAIYELRSWFESSPGRAWRSRAYFLTGQAGSGKTHLFLDATSRALDAGRPAVFLAGARFGQGNLWASVCDQLGLEAVGADILLRAMDSAGEAASLTGRRFVIFVDALNETRSPEFWRTHLPALRAAVAPYPHVALAVSCRDTYKDLVLEETESVHYVRRNHPGFADREVEATHRYFAHYQLEAPKIPLLTPEFSLPLFLRLFCESMADAGTARLTGHQGRVAIFERYLAAKIKTSAQRFRPGATSDYELKNARKQIGKVIDALLDEFSRTGQESMSATTAESVTQAQLGGVAAETVQLIGILQDEGILTEERLYLGDNQYDDGVRIVFQAFSDFLLLKRRFATSLDPLNDKALATWLKDECSWGVREAATVFVPEVHKVELVDLLGVTFSARPSSSRGDAAWLRYNQTVYFYESLVNTLPQRDSAAVNDRTIELLNIAQPYFTREEFYRVLLTLAPQKANPLNGDRLHRYLIQRSMPVRDLDFGFAMYHELSDPFGPVARLARWAADGPYPTYDSDVVELACIPLCWLLASPNRFMRDWVTKALVQLLRGHLNVATRLVDRFWTVDDPYVVQRVIVIAYGALLRRPAGLDKDARALVKLVHRLVFSPPVRADELMLDAARGIVRAGVAQKLIRATALAQSQRPYGLNPPSAPPSEKTIEARYAWKENQPAKESYSSLRFSLLHMGDFARYVVESGLHHFSRYRVGQNYPTRQDRTPRFIKRRWTGFIASLSAEQKLVLAATGSEPEEIVADRWFSRTEFIESLSDEQRTLLNAVCVYSNHVDDSYPAAGGCRWIFRRTISLGWTPKRFGDADRSIGHGDMGREAHKAERWGKKYQWMAYHELLARVADNYQSARRYDDDVPYEGLHQIIAEREIDPSLPPIDYRAFNEHEGTGATGWAPPLVSLKPWPLAQLHLDLYKGSIKALVVDQATEPSLKSLLFTTDQDGDDWVVLNGSTKQIDAKTPKSWRGIQQYATTHSLFVPAGQAKPLTEWIAGSGRDDLRDVLDTHGHVDCCYVGEVGRSGAPVCFNRHEAMKPTEFGDVTLQTVMPVERFTWEGSLLDCSIGESASAMLPSAFVQSASQLSFDLRGPSWLDSTGNPVFTNYTVQGTDAEALLVRASFLREFMKTHDVELVATLWFQRMLLDGDHEANPYMDANSEGWFGADMVLHEGMLRRDVRNV